MRTLDSTLRFTGVAQNVTVGAASVPTTAGISANIHDVRLVSTTNCWINVGAAPTAAFDVNNMYLPANVVEYLHVTPGQKIAVIQNAAGGTLNVAEMSR